jgi:hypothetical protein
MPMERNFHQYRPPHCRSATLSPAGPLGSASGGTRTLARKVRPTVTIRPSVTRERGRQTFLSVIRTVAIIALASIATIVSACSDDSQSDNRSGATSQTTATKESQHQPQDKREGEPSESSTYRAELSRIERAEPEPRSKGSPGANLEQAKKVKGPSGATYFITPHKIRRTATAATPGCDNGSPQPPGITARRTSPTALVVTYLIGGDDENCRAEWIRLLVDRSDDFSPGDLHSPFPIAKERKGQVTLPIPSNLASADILVAETRTKRYGGAASRNTTVRIH